MSTTVHSALPSFEKVEQWDSWLEQLFLKPDSPLRSRLAIGRHLHRAILDVYHSQELEVCQLALADAVARLLDRTTAQPKHHERLEALLLLVPELKPRNSDITLDRFLTGREFEGLKFRHRSLEALILTVRATYILDEQFVEFLQTRAATTDDLQLLLAAFRALFQSPSRSPLTWKLLTHILLVANDPNDLRLAGDIALGRAAALGCQGFLRWIWSNRPGIQAADPQKWDLFAAHLSTAFVQRETAGAHLTARVDPYVALITTELTVGTQQFTARHVKSVLDIGADLEPEDTAYLLNRALYNGDPEHPGRKTFAFHSTDATPFSARIFERPVHVIIDIWDHEVPLTPDEYSRHKNSCIKFLTSTRSIGSMLRSTCLMPLDVFSRLSAFERTALLQHHRLVKKDTSVFWAIDPFEVNTFAFPFSAKPRITDLEEFANSQPAQDEVIRHSPHPPLILKQYEEELQQQRNILRIGAREIRDHTITLLKLTEDFTQTHATANETLQKIEDRFGQFLAGWLGLYSLGIDRFTSVCSNDIVCQSDDAARHLDCLREITAEYHPSPLINTATSILTKFVCRKTPEQLNVKQYDDYKILRAAETDAHALDWLIFANRHLEERFQSRELERRIVNLYFSSAPRSDHLFTHDDFRHNLPVVDGDPLHFLRTRRQVLAELLRSLRERHVLAPSRHSDVVNDPTASIDQCDDCVLKESVPAGCDKRDLCEELKRRLDGIHNLTLFSGYRKFLVARKERPEAAKLSDYRRYLDSLSTDDNFVEAALERLRLQRHRLLVQGRFLTEESIVLRGRRDFITVVEIHLPIYPSIAAEPYRTIVDQLISCYQMESSATLDVWRNIDKCYENFMVLEPCSEPSHTIDHEITRCLLYLGFPGHEGDLDALANSRGLLTEVGRADQEMRYYAVHSCLGSAPTGRIQRGVRPGLQRHNTVPSGFPLPPRTGPHDYSVVS